MRKSIFHEDWWLDALAPGRWREVSCLRGGRSVGSLRFVERSEGSMRICEMPHITRVLGPVVEPQSGKSEARTRTTHAIVSDLLNQVSRHSHVEMILDTGFSDLAPFLHAGYEVRAHPTLLLDCSRSVDALWGGLRDKVRNVIRRARECLTVCDIDDVDLFVRFYETNLEGEDPYFDLSLLTAAVASARARGQCKILAAMDKSHMAHAMVVFIWDDKYVYYFLSSRERNLAHVGAISLLLWTGIELAHARRLCMDFDGGIMKDSRYKFLISFGGEVANRFEVVRSSPGYRVRHAIKRAPRAIMRRLASIAERPAKFRILLGLCWVYLAQTFYGRLTCAIEMAECFI